MISALDRSAAGGGKMKPWEKVSLVEYTKKAAHSKMSLPWSRQPLQMPMYRGFRDGRRGDVFLKRPKKAT